jgi:2-phospho-L-lactate guanylyltransferase
MSLRRNKPKTCAILPVKPFDDAKERLSTGLDAAQRKLIAEAMVRDVFAALAESRELDGVVVISPEPAIAEIAGETASAVLADERTGHSDAAKRGVEWAIDHEYDRVVMIPGDCPLLSARELDDLLLRCQEDRIEFAIIPDRMGTGTNALVIQPPAAVAPAFGEGSRARHVALGLAAGVRVAEIEVPTLALDLDTAEDLLELAERVAEPDHDAVNTEQAIAALMTDRRRLPGGYAR